MKKLSETIFEMVAADKEAVTRFHTSSNRYAMGKEELDKKGPQYWRSQTRQIIPEPEPLKAGLDKLWQEFSGPEGNDPETGEPLFTDLTWDVLTAIKEPIDHGHFCGKSTTVEKGVQLFTVCRAGKPCNLVCCPSAPSHVFAPSHYSVVVHPFRWKGGA